jgi:hypothetical protein
MYVWAGPAGEGGYDTAVWRGCLHVALLASLGKCLGYQCSSLWGGGGVGNNRVARPDLRMPHTNMPSSGRQAWCECNMAPSAVHMQGQSVITLQVCSCTPTVRYS